MSTAVPAPGDPPRSPQLNKTGQSADSLHTHATVAETPEFKHLQKSFRSFIFPLTGAFLIWYFLYVLLAAFAPGFMATKVIGNINIGLIFGLLQFVTTFAITMWYRSWANNKFDPEAHKLRVMVEGER